MLDSLGCSTTDSTPRFHQKYTEGVLRQTVILQYLGLHIYNPPSSSLNFSPVPINIQSSLSISFSNPKLYAVEQISPVSTV